MTVFQQISPSSLRAYKLSRYANGQPNKILLEAKKAKRATSQFMSRKGAREAAKRMKALKKTTKESKNILDNFLKKVPGKGSAGKSANAGVMLGGLVAIAGLTAALIIKEFRDAFIQGVLLDSDDYLRSEIQKNFNNYIKQAVEIKGINERTKNLELENQRVRDRVYGLEKQQPLIRENANEALYEARQGRIILEGKIADAKKQANDALYETRQGREKLQSQIDSIQASVKQALSGITKGFQQQINTTIANIQKGLQQAQTDTKKVSTQADTQNKAISNLQASNKLLETKINSIKQPTSLDVNAVINNIKASSTQEINRLRLQVNGLLAQLTGIQSVIPALSSGISNLSSGVAKVDAKASSALNEARSKGVPDLSPLQKQLDNQFTKFVEDNKKSLGIQDLKISDLGKKFNQDLQNFQRQNNLDANQRFSEFTKQNNEALGIRDLKISDLGKDFDRKFADFQRQSNLDADQRYKEFVDQNKRDLQKIGNDLSQSKSDIKDLEKQIDKQDKVNEEANKKLDKIIPMLGAIPLIPGRVADAIRPDIPTIPDIERAATTGVCRSTQPGGCMNRALNDQSNNINNNTNNAANNILQGLDTAGTGALLSGQQEILNRLGDQLPGGIGGKLERFSKWLHLDRVLNMMIWATTIHNALMLSNDIGQTLTVVINNVLNLIPGLKGDNDQPFDIGSVIGSTIDNLIKGAIGADNYTQLKETWAKANRIYQATTNVLNNLMNVNAVITNALEVIGSYTGRIGNALRIWGVVGEKAYSWMNPQPNFDNKWMTKLQQLQEGANTVAMVAQVPIDVTNAVAEFNNSTTEFIKAIKQEPGTHSGLDIGEATNVKTQREAAKAVSASLNFDISDLFDADD
ncbi:hypothetical protein I8748_16515 [Nostoc sp. CENA67]|uniref:Uncharacterized protein n=1 Tax=Amazonocrinis nigriterrae CENA67 TaxID=2794033 RepID=A0A8J7HTD1_9NOST|nr:hypothetical protein [Amazonocrinis nigriterrae]MBH8563775.1 hypothetical protein [Amazonocrinis nigriterrae CENA67]